METRYSKGRSGQEARTRLEMPELNQYRGTLPGGEKTARLTISTSKGYRGLLSTTVSVAWADDGVETFAIFGDFMIHPIREQARCTEKAVREQHERALAQVEHYKGLAREFYAAKEKEIVSALLQHLARAGLVPVSATDGEDTSPLDFADAAPRKAMGVHLRVKGGHLAVEPIRIACEFYAAKAKE